MRDLQYVRAEILPGTVGADSPEGVECRAAIHWVDAATAADGEVRIYERLFSVESPDDADGGFLSVINTDSLKLKVHSSDNFKATPFLQGTNQLVKVKYITWTGQLVNANPRYSGVMFNLT